MGDCPSYGPLPLPKGLALTCPEAVTAERQLGVNRLDSSADRRRPAEFGQDPPVALIKCLPRSGRSHCNQGGSGGRIWGLLGSALGLISGDRHLQPRSFPRCRCYPTRAALEVIVQPHRRIMRARIGKAGFFQLARHFTAAGRNKKPADGVCGLLVSLLADC